MEFKEAWAVLRDELESHPDAPELFPLDSVRNACEVFYEIGKLAGIDRDNLLVDMAVRTAIAEIRQNFHDKS